MSDNGFSWDKIIGQSDDQLPESKDKDAELSDILRQISERGKTSEAGGIRGSCPCRRARSAAVCARRRSRIGTRSGRS